MEINTVRTLGKPVGRLWMDLQREYTQKGNFYFASPLSNTPRPIYRWVFEHAKEFAGWEKVRFILMDELVTQNLLGYEYILNNDSASFEKFAKETFLSPIRKIVFSFNDEVLKPNLNKLTQWNVSIDLLILALGIKGNYANIMPGTPLKAGWHIAKLIPEYITSHTQVKSGIYEGAKFTNFGMSLGHQQVIAAKNVVVIISGKNKRELATQLFSYTEFTPVFPLSIIYHPKVQKRVTIFITKDVFD